MSNEQPSCVLNFWNYDPRASWINWLTIDADGVLKGHEHQPVYGKHGDWDSDGVSIWIEMVHPENHPKNLIWKKPSDGNPIEEPKEVKLTRELSSVNQQLWVLKWDIKNASFLTRLKYLLNPNSFREE